MVQHDGLLEFGVEGVGISAACWGSLQESMLELDHKLGRRVRGEETALGERIGVYDILLPSSASWAVSKGRGRFL